MGAPSKKAKKVRTESDFDTGRILRALKPPPDSDSVYSWTLANIFAARDAQMRGQFALPARLAAAMRTDDALAVARSNRLAPQRCIGVEIVPSAGTAGSKPAKEAEALYGQGGIAVSPGTLADINGCLVDHGVAFATNEWTVREDGTRTDCEVRYWPIEHVRWDSYQRCFVTRIDMASAADEGGGSEVPIVHGDGRWIVFSTHEHEPFKQEAAILPGALVWARHAYGLRDWAKSSVAHGSAKIVGEMPEGTALQDESGTTPQGAAFLELLRALASSDSPVGIRPSGAKTEFVTNTSTAWQVFNELVLNAEKAAARIYLGTDGTLGSQGGAPGVDVAALFGVARTKVQGDLSAISRGLDTGSIQVWCALNFGTSVAAPTRKYQIPDEDEDAYRASYGARKTAFYADVQGARDAGFDVTQTVVDALAKKHDVETMLLKPTAAVAEPVAAPGVPPALRAV